MNDVSTEGIRKGKAFSLIETRSPRETPMAEWEASSYWKWNDGMWYYISSFCGTVPQDSGLGIGLASSPEGQSGQPDVS